MSRPHLSAPNPQHPPGLGFIVGNEAAERFSYYGMKSILVVFMTSALMNSSGELDVLSERAATFWYHIFTMGNYLLPLLGALLADVVWGKYRTIIVLSVVYCFGHLALAIDETRVGLAIGLSLIAIGSGGIKPCVSAHLGDQYHSQSTTKRSEGFSLFYLAINLGAFASTLLIPYLFATYGASTAFGVPGVLMAIATVIFWLGRNTYTTVPPTPWSDYRSTLLHIGNRRQLGRLALLYGMVSIFWSLFDQTGSSWVLQAEHLDRHIILPFFGETELLAAQLQALNPILIMVFTPLCAWGLFPWLRRRGVLSDRMKLSIGMLLASLSFLVVAMAQNKLTAGVSASVSWQATAYVFLTAAEVLVSVTTLEMAYTWAPGGSKSFVTSFYLLSVALGNGITALSTNYLPALIGEPSTVTYFLFFAALPLLLVFPIGRVVMAIETNHSSTTT